MIFNTFAITIFSLFAFTFSNVNGQTKTCFECENGQCDYKSIAYTSTIFSIDTDKYIKLNYTVDILIKMNKYPKN